MTCISGDKLIKALATGLGFTNIVIYKGYDLDLITHVCLQVCHNGVRENNVWHPPHKINHIKLEVENYEGGFTQYEKETIERLAKESR